MANNYLSDSDIIAFWAGDSGNLLTEDVAGKDLVRFYDAGNYEGEAEATTGIEGGCIKFPVNFEGDVFDPGIGNIYYYAIPTLLTPITVSFWYKWDFVNDIATATSTIESLNGGWNWRFAANAAGYSTDSRPRLKIGGITLDSIPELARSTWYLVTFTLESDRTLVTVIYEQGGSVHYQDTSTTISLPPTSYSGILIQGGTSFEGENPYQFDSFYDSIAIFGRVLTPNEKLNISLGSFGPQPLLSFPSERPDDYDPDLIWQPGEWTDSETYVPGEWGAGYVATGGGRWGQNLVVCGNKKIYYEPFEGV